MSKKQDKWEFYVDAANNWRWRRTAKNGEIIDASTEGYKNRYNCVENAIRCGYREDYFFWEEDKVRKPKKGALDLGGYKVGFLLFLVGLSQFIASNQPYYIAAGLVAIGLSSIITSEEVVKKLKFNIEGSKPFVLVFAYLLSVVAIVSFGLEVYFSLLG